MTQEKLWDYFQVEDDSESNVFGASNARYKYLAERIRTGDSVLNIGVGRGGLERLLLAKQCSVASLDPSDKTIAKLKEDLGLADRARVGSSQKIPFDDNEFDVVVMSEVLEHLTDDLIIATLPEVKRVLKEGTGRFMGTVPADENLAESQCVCPHCGEIFHRWGHVQSFTRERLSKLLAAQFRSTSIGRRHFADPARLNWKGKVVWIAKSLLLALEIPGKNDNFFFLSQ